MASPPTAVKDAPATLRPPRGLTGSAPPPTGTGALHAGADHPRNKKVNMRSIVMAEMAEMAEMAGLAEVDFAEHHPFVWQTMPWL